MKDNLIRGLASLERGGRSNNLHIQAVIELGIGKDPRDIARMKQSLKDFVPILPTHRVKMPVKPLVDGQAFQEMLGYCQKDFGMAHYRMVKHLVSDEAEAGRHSYSDLQSDYKTNKVLITKKCLSDRLYSFWKSNY